MAETDNITGSGITHDLRTDAEKWIDEHIRRYSDIPEPVPEKDNPDALFEGGWGRRKSFSLLIASSGIGKSVISTQLFVPWALGKPGIIGSAPLRPLHVAFIQAEDDDTEMGEFRRDHRKGYADEGWLADEVRHGESLVWDWSPAFEGLTDDDFITRLDITLKMHPQDVIVLNPFQSYTNYDLNDNEKMKQFVQHGLLQTMKEHNAFMLIVHHTNKPNYNNLTKGNVWGADDLAAYAGAGGATLTNSARSVTFIRRCVEKESKLENSFMLIGAKRGNRLGWKDADGKKTNKRVIAYSEDYIHWRIPTPEEIKGGEDAEDSKADKAPKTARVALGSEEVAARIAAIIRAERPTKGICGYLRDKLCADMTRTEFMAGWDRFQMDPAVYGLKRVNDGNRQYHYEADPNAAQDDLDFNDSQPNYGGQP